MHLIRNRPNDGEIGMKSFADLLKQTKVGDLIVAQIRHGQELNTDA